MGAGESKTSTAVNDAKALLSTAERDRLTAAWKEMGRESMEFKTFYYEIFDEAIPLNAATALFDVFANQSRFITYDQLVSGLAILTTADLDTRETWFNSAEECYTDVIPEAWIDNPPKLTADDEVSAANIYEILSGVTHLTEIEIKELEKIWGTLSDAKWCKITKERFTSIVSPPLFDVFADGLFTAFDENDDGKIDFREFVCGLSASCRGPKGERLKLLFKVLDPASTSVVTVDRLSDLNGQLLAAGYIDDDIDMDFEEQELNLASFLTWASETGGVDVLLNMIVEVGHVCFGLRPTEFHEEQHIIRSLVDRLKVLDHTEWMLLPVSWWDHYLASQYKQDVPKIDTSPLCIQEPWQQIWQKLPSQTSEGGFLHGDLREGVDYMVIMPTVWSTIVRWYGHKGPPIKRYVIDDPHGKERILELYPPTMVILRHQPLSMSSQTTSWSNVASYLKDSLLQSFAGSQPMYRRAAQYSVTFSETDTVERLFTFLCQKHRYDQESTRLWLLLPHKENTSTKREDKGISDMLLLEDNTLTLAELNIKSGSQILLEVRSPDLTWPEEVLQLKARGHYKLDLRLQASQEGVTGLNNLGNTCFMNSALQCISNTPRLTEYFMSGDYAKHLNRRSPLGYGGEIAQEYATLLKELWSTNYKVVAPLKFRSIIVKHHDRFHDSAQHDCQEFLSMLLDSLHEDLNRVGAQGRACRDVLKDSDGRDDQIVSDEAWQHYKTRNDSIIVDLCTGQLKSEVQCAVCQTSSTRFDPFVSLSLPLPVDDHMLFYVNLSRLDGSVPRRYGMRLSAECRLSDLLQQLALLGKVPVESLMLFKLNMQGAFVRRPHLTEKLRNVAVRDTIWFAYELKLVKKRSESSVSNGHVPNGHIPSLEDADAFSEPDCSTTSGYRDDFAEYAIAVHRKMEYKSVYFLAASHARPVIFGIPMIVPLHVDAHQPTLTGAIIYERIWTLVQRFVDPPVVKRHGQAAPNRAFEAEDSYQYPFVVRYVNDGHERCGKCAWHVMCVGCVIPLNDSPIQLPPDTKLAVDWDLTCLHLRFQHSELLACVEDETVEESTRVHHEPITLSSCLTRFTAAEKLDGGEAVFCKKCDGNQAASIKPDIWRVPDVLIIHLKRFVFHDNRWMKSSKLIDFELTGFDMSPYVLSPDDREELIYDCYAMANQYGAISAGHYVAYAKNPRNDRWYIYNDSRCKEVSEKDIDHGNAYILFYARRRPETFNTNL